MVNAGGLLYYPYWYHDSVEERGVNLPEDYPGFEGDYVQGWVWEFPEWDQKEFLVELQKSNPERLIYVAIVEGDYPEVIYHLEPIVLGSDGIYIVPGS